MGDDKIERRQDTVQIYYWSCGSPLCTTKHQSKEAAINCPKRYRKHVPRVDHGLCYVRTYCLMNALRMMGCTWQQIGDHMGVSGHRARQLYAKGERIDKQFAKQWGLDDG